MATGLCKLYKGVRGGIIMKGMWKKATCAALSVTMLFSLTGCFGGGKDGNPSEAIANAANSQAAKEAVYKEIGAVTPDCEWFDRVLINGEDVIVVWSEYNELMAGDTVPGGEAVPYTEDGAVEEPVTEEGVDEPVTEEGVDEPVAEEGLEGNIENDVMMPEVEYDPEYEYSFSYTITFGKTSYGGSGIDEVQITLPEREYMSNVSVDKATGNYLLITEKGEDSYTDAGEYMYKQYLFMNVYSATGELLNRQELDFGNNAEESVSIYGMGATDNGDICIVSYNKVYVFDSSLRKVGEIKFSDSQWIEGFVMTDEGEPYVYVWTDGGDGSQYDFYPIDTMQLKAGAAVEPPTEFWGNAMSGAGHDLYYSTDKGIYAYDFDTKENKKLMDFVDSDVDYNYFNYCIPVDEEHFVAVMNDSETWMNYIAFFEKVPPEEVQDKIIITMGMLYIDYEIREKVIAFNKASDEYRIRMIEYYEYNNESDWEAGAKMFNNDIITSNAPDIIVMNPDMPIDSYMEKGVLLNLNPYIEQDAEIFKEDMAPNVLALGSSGDDTYILTASYMVSTLAMKESLVPNGQSISLSELMQVEAQKGNIKAFQTMTRNDVIRYAMEMNYSEFLDVESGKCEFNTPAFYELLEYAKSYPEEIDWDSMDDEYWMNSQYAIRNDEALLQYFSIADFRSVAYTEQGTYGEKVAFVGFPGSSGNTGVIYPYTQMAISKDCKYPEEAWQFMRQFYTYDAQVELDYGIPVNMKAMDEMLAEAQQRPYWIDEDGNKVEYDDYYWIEDQEILINPLTAERAQEVKEYVLSVENVYYYDTAIVDIIIEEAAPFFAGQKTAQQAADIIQSRIQIYVNENR